MSDMTADIWHRDGIDWGEAPLPPEDHRCFVQTSGWIGLNQWLRCPCGAIAAGIDLKSVQGLKSYEADDGLWNGLWMERNDRRRHEEKKAMMPDWQNPPYDQDAEDDYETDSLAGFTPVGWQAGGDIHLFGEDSSHVSHPDWIQRGLLTILGLILAFLVFTAGYAAGHKSRDPFTQDGFPCQKDEVLGYSPAFGPDRVGCLHVDLLAP